MQGVFKNGIISPAIVFLAVFLVCLVVTKRGVSYSGNEASRLALVESLIERRTFAIDASPFLWTSDKVRINGKFYCDKPPLLPLFSAAEAWALKLVFGVSYSSGPRAWVYLLTVLSVGLAAAWLAAIFFRDTGVLWGVSGVKIRLLWTTAAWAGTLVFAYCGTYNNHVPAAAFLYAAFSKFASSVKSDRMWHSGWPPFVTGVLSGLAWALDYPTGAIFLVVFGIAVLISAPRSSRLRSMLWYTCGAVIPIAATAAANFAMVGDPRPLYLLPGAYDYPGSSFPRGGMAGTYSPAHPALYAFHVLFGYRGFFIYSPILIPSAVGLAGFALRGGGWEKFTARVVATGCTALVAFYVASTNNFGGWAYGFRYLVPVMPLLVFFIKPKWMESSGFRRVVFLVVLVVSVLLAALGNFNPWSPCYEGERAGQNPLVANVKTPFAANLVLLQAVINPTGAPRSLPAKWLVSRDEARAAAYIGLAFLNRRDTRRAALMFNYSIKLKPDHTVEKYLEIIRSTKNGN